MNRQLLDHRPELDQISAPTNNFALLLKPFDAYSAQAHYFSCKLSLAKHFYDKSRTITQAALEAGVIKLADLQEVADAHYTFDVCTGVHSKLYCDGVKLYWVGDCLACDESCQATDFSAASDYSYYCDPTRTVYMYV